jgi:hypothetical protein
MKKFVEFLGACRGQGFQASGFILRWSLHTFCGFDPVGPVGRLDHRAGKPYWLPQRFSGRLRLPAVAKQLQQVGGSANQLPLGAHLLKAAEVEEAEASLLLDLSEDRFDDDLAPPVNGLSSLGAQFVLHGMFGGG